MYNNKQIFEPGTRVKCVFTSFHRTGKMATIVVNDPNFDSDITVKWDDGCNDDPRWAYKSSFEVITDSPTPIPMQTIQQIKIDPYNGGIQL